MTQEVLDELSEWLTRRGHQLSSSPLLRVLPSTTSIILRGRLFLSVSPVDCIQSCAP